MEYQKELRSKDHNIIMATATDSVKKYHPVSQNIFHRLIRRLPLLLEKLLKFLYSHVILFWTNLFIYTVLP